MPQVVGREVGQIMGFHKPLDTAGHSVGVPGLENTPPRRKNEAVCEDSAGIFPFSPLPISLRGFTVKRVIAPQDVTTPEDETRIRTCVQEVDQLWADMQA